VQRQELDDRPAPWVLYAMLVALGLFLVHNLVDFSLFEPGPLSIFAFVCGAALGVRTPPVSAAGGSPRGARRALVVAAVAWLVITFAFAAPVAVAEQAAADGDEGLRARRLDRAADDFERALGTVPYNADYAFRAARALLFAPDPRPHTDRVIRLLDRAVALDPTRAEYWLSRANAEFLRPSPDAALVRRGYERALRLDPNSVQSRLDYAALLTRLGDSSGARDQYEAALRQNDLLSPDEPKRLPPAKLEQIRKAISDLPSPART
jgi:tetratricopeptide (TPR) repeat protein